MSLNSLGSSQLTWVRTLECVCVSLAGLWLLLEGELKEDFSCLPMTLVRSFCSGSAEELMHKCANETTISDNNSRNWLPSFMGGKLALKSVGKITYAMNKLYGTPLSSS